MSATCSVTARHVWAIHSTFDAPSTLICFHFSPWFVLRFGRHFDIWPFSLYSFAFWSLFSKDGNGAFRTSSFGANLSLNPPFPHFKRNEAGSNPPWFIYTQPSPNSLLFDLVLIELQYYCSIVQCLLQPSFYIICLK